jgi:hypothetical protein
MKLKAIRQWKNITKAQSKYGLCHNCIVDSKTLALYCGGSYIGQVDKKDMRITNMRIKRIRLRIHTIKWNIKKLLLKTGVR